MKPTVYLMRGLPSCGKSFKARSLVGDTGVIFETDEYFFTEVGDDPEKYDYDTDLLDTAREWNFQRFCKAVDEKLTPIAVDRGNGLNVETRRYARYAVDRGYHVELQEPDSEWWQEIRVLLKYKHLTGPALDEWADKLAKKNKETHRAKRSTIRRWMSKWKHDVTVEKILAYRDKKTEK